jgi:hypothetical protein
MSAAGMLFSIELGLVASQVSENLVTSIMVIENLGSSITISDQGAMEISVLIRLKMSHLELERDFCGLSR